MQVTLNVKKCKKHQLDCVAISNQQETTDRYMCPRCLQQLLNNNNIALIEDVQKSFDNAKETYKNIKQEKIKANISILLDLESKVQSLKKYYINSIDQISSGIIKFIQLFESEQNQLIKHDQLTLDDFILQQSEVKEWEFDFLENLNNLQKEFLDINKTDILNICICTLQLLDQKVGFNIENQNQHTVSPLVCQSHGREIFFVEESSKSLACISCVTENEPGEYSELALYQERWIDYQSQRKQVLNIYLEQRRKKTLETHKNLQFFQENIQQAMRDFYQCLQLYGFIQYNQKDQNSLTEEEILNIDLDEDLDEQLDRILGDMEFEEEEIDQKFQQVMVNFDEIYIQFQEKMKEFIEIKYDEQEMEEGLTNILEEYQESNSDSESDSQNSIEQDIDTYSEDSSDNQIDSFSIYKGKRCIRQVFPSYSMAFNKYSNVMIAGCENYIKIYNFDDKSIQVMAEHSSDIAALYCFQNRNQFISGSMEGQIRILIYQIDNSTCKQILKDGHSSWISQIIMNKIEDIMITCSNDSLIKIWSELFNEWVCIQTLSDHGGCVRGISLNQSENKLVSCGLDQLIIINEQNNNKIWCVNQIISVQQIGLRVCFFGDNFITFQAQYSKQLDIFKINKDTSQFEQFQNIKYNQDPYYGCYCWFPQIYNSKTNKLINKSGTYIYLIQQNQNGEFFISQSFKFNNYLIFGALTNDGKKMITWDAGIGGFQIHKIE